MSIAVEFQDVVKRFPNATENAVDHVSFQIQEKEMITILGTSGCGKTTLMKMGNRLYDPTSGEIHVYGENIQKTDPVQLRRKIGYVIQQVGLFPHMTVEKNIAVVPEILGWDAERIHTRVTELLELVNLNPERYRNRYPAQLSGGQQQRGALARILAYEPEALLLDEPFSAMDTHLRERLRLELASVLSEYQGASVMVTHDRDEAYQLCDNLLLFSKGHVIAAGKTKDIFNDPGSVEAARLTGCKNISRIEKLDEHRVRALDWDNLELVTDKTVTEDVTSIGIRAHDFEPVAEPEGMNRIPVENPKVSEMPFEWYITLQNGLWWKIGKTIHTHSADGLIPKYLRVAPEAILLLKD